MKSSVTTSAPGKLMLFGEHAVVYGHPCIVTAVDQRLKVTLKVSEKQNGIRIDAKDVGIIGYEKSFNELGQGEVPKGVSFIEIAVKKFIERVTIDSGLQITTRSEFSSTFGFGSSSATTVAVVKALSELFEVHLSDREIFDLSYKTVLDIQKKGSGFDVAAAVYGGTVYFQNGGETIVPLIVGSLPIVVGYSGVKADTVTLIEKVADLKRIKPEVVEKIFAEITQIVIDAKKELEKEDFETVGKLMNRNQMLLSELGVNSQKLDDMIFAAQNAGAYGAKLSGAGGGDCIITLCAKSKEQRAKDAIKNAGGEIMEVRTNAEGTRIENSKS